MPGPNAPQFLRNKMLGVLLKDAREAAHKSVRQAAEFLGMTSSMLSAFESGRRAITLPELEALAYTYDVPIRHFLYNAQFLTENKREKIDLNRLILLRQKMIATKLRQLRAEKNLRLGELGKKSGLTVRRVKAYENGVRPIPLADLESLATGLGVEVGSFLEYHGPVGEWEMNRESDDQFQKLPSDIRRFAAQPVHEPYLRLAMKLSELPVDRLRDIAESLLDITL
ncbi:MAG: helix-turn-helix domain-containing protein [Anaerolineales bacterium]|nr:helix-turn-helix domain-containing protein [Anaerolineales bacterium]